MNVNEDFPVAPGLCGALLRISCDFRDNPVTFKCGLKDGHDGLHEEVYVDQRDPADFFRMKWSRNDRPQLIQQERMLAEYRAERDRERGRLPRE